MVGDARRPERFSSVDALRGAVMIIMALDHVRDFIHRAAQTSSPTNLATTTTMVFLTRWVTHICAPVFMFTAGLGAYFWWHMRGRTRRHLSLHLLKRGLWLVVLEVTVMRVAYNFDMSARDPLLLVVLWALGGCMIGLAALAWVPPPLLVGLSIATIFVHNAVDGVSSASLDGWWAGLWKVLHEPGAISAGGLLVIVAYPLVPWIAVMSAGFCCGRLFEMEAGARRRILLWAGAVATLGFVGIRAANGYGDPAPWAVERSRVLSVLSFLNCTKYPPSLDFLLMTLGPALMVLAWFDRLRWEWAGNPLIVFGREPLFYFVVHFYAAHAAAVLLAAGRYGVAETLRFAFHPVPSMGGPRLLFPADFGYSLGVVYVVWAAIVAGLYPACRWYGRRASGRSAGGQR
jgi:uncharacterized membrane protein